MAITPLNRRSIVAVQQAVAVYVQRHNYADFCCLLEIEPDEAAEALWERLVGLSARLNEFTPEMLARVVMTVQLEDSL